MDVCEPVSKVSQLAEQTAIGDDDLLFVSEDAGGGSFVSKFIKGINLFRKVDVFLNPNLPALIIRK